ncbi:MAG: SPFH domain-containing protein [Bacilli bacterium]|nr:SPFH domain-containing protein [Bacilli bacterium]
MGFIKAIAGASSQVGETFRETLQYDFENENILVKMITTESGIIQDQSRLFVQPGQCAIYTDQGAIKDIISEPGMYFMDTSAPTLFQTNIFKGIGQTFLESMKRIAYEGEAILKQKVYFINIAEFINQKFRTLNPVIYKDPEWGPIEVILNGEFTLKVVNPINLLTNVTGSDEIYYIDSIASQIRSFILSELSVELGKLNVSFTDIASNQSSIAEGIIETLNKKLESFGMETSKVVITSIEVAEEIKEAMRERTGIKMKATSVSSEEADIYTKLNTAEAIKDMANNPNSNGAAFMGMNIGNSMAGIFDRTLNPDDEK